MNNSDTFIMIHNEKLSNGLSAKYFSKFEGDEFVDTLLRHKEDWNYYIIENKELR
jgi:hypothetical protein